MFGLGMGELVVIAIVALLALGPDKLPAAAKALGKGIRDLKKQTRDLQETIERDTDIGDAVRDLKSALRGEEPPPPRPPVSSSAVAGSASEVDRTTIVADADAQGASEHIKGSLQRDGESSGKAVANTASIAEENASVSFARESVPLIRPASDTVAFNTTKSSSANTGVSASDTAVPDMTELDAATAGAAEPTGGEVRSDWPHDSSEPPHG